MPALRRRSDVFQRCGFGSLPDGFSVLVFGAADVPRELEVDGLAVRTLRVGADLHDVEGLLAARYDGRPGTTYLLRPDQHVAARWRAFDAARITAAVRRATGR